MQRRPGNPDAGTQGQTRPHPSPGCTATPAAIRTTQHDPPDLVHHHPVGRTLQREARKYAGGPTYIGMRPN